MADFKTELEGETTPNSTVLESGGGLSGTVLESGVQAARGGVFGPGDNFGGYRIIDRLRVTSAEADLYVIEYPGDERRFTLKLYRYGIEPKREILDRVQSLRREHIVEIHHAGELNGCQYEIQEFVEHGSLADLLKQGRLDETKIREALLELATALAHLHDIDILHRDIKPSNILIRSKEPTLDLILTDFGISSISDLSLVLSAVRRTPAYSAPEASTPVLVKKATDWWSVGIILIEMLTGQHPFAGMDDLAISLHLATKSVPISQSLSPDWQMIIKGLLTRDPRKRWGFEQVSQWLEGRRDIPVFFESEVAQATHSYSYRPYKFAGQELFDPAELATALAEQWDEAVKRVGRLDILKWVKEQLGDADMANALQDVADDRKLNEYQKLAVALLILNPKLPLIWRDAVINLDWMQANPMIAPALLESSVPQWLKKLRNEPWMETLQERRLRIWDKLGQVQKINRDLAERLILGPPEVAHAEAQQVREATFSSQVPAVDHALHRGEINEAEAILLAACDRSLLWSKEQEVARQAEEAEKQRQLEIAERERQRQSELAEHRRRQEEAAEETRQRKIRNLNSRFALANVLGWFGLLFAFMGPLCYIGLVLAGISVCLVFEYWCRATRREQLRGGHTIAFWVVILLPLILWIISAVSSANIAAQKKAAADLLALQQRAEDEPTAFVWEYMDYEGNADFPSVGTVQFTKLNYTAIIDKLTDSEVQFHVITNGFNSGFFLYTWTSQGGGEGFGTDETWTFDILQDRRSPNQIVWKSWNDKREKYDYRMIDRTAGGLQLFQPKGWMLFRQNAGKWENYATFGNQDAQVSNSAINISSRVGEGVLHNPLAPYVTNIAFLWNENQTSGSVTYEQSNGVSLKSSLSVDLAKSSFPNGPIYLTETRDGAQTFDYLLLRY